MTKIGDLFKGGSVGEQFLLWNVGSQIAQAVMGPFLQAIQNRTWKADPNVPLSPAEAADLAQRGMLTPDQAADEAAASGTSRQRFDAMLQGAGRPPDLGSLLEMVRRGIIADDTGTDGLPSLIAALIDAGIRPEWVNAVSQLRTQIPSVAEVMNAWLEGQIDEVEANRRYLLAGGDPTWFRTSYNANGTAPSPVELGDLANRGIIPWDGTGPDAVSFHQGILEGPTRNKWLAPLRAQAQYRIPPRSITAMLHNGALTDAQALQKFREYGMTAEDAAAMLADAHHAKAATAKELTLSQIGQLYKDAKIDRAKALQLIVALGWSEANAELILSLQDVAKADAHVTAAINRVRAYYTAHKITRDAARRSLTDLKVSGPQADELLALWELELGLNVKQLTPAQIVGAWDLGIMSQAEATTELQHLGYTEFDAWVLLSLHAKAAQPNRPAEGAGVGVNP